MIQVGGYEVPKEDWESTPASVRELVMKLVKGNEGLRGKAHRLEERVNEIEERLNQNSGNSSRPPSKDEPGKKREKKISQIGSRKRGGQKGHQGNQRYLYKPEDCKAIKEVKPETCGHCGNELRGEDENPYRHQVVEIPPVKPEVIEYRPAQANMPGMWAWNPSQVAEWSYPERLWRKINRVSGCVERSPSSKSWISARATEGSIWRGDIDRGNKSSTPGTQ